MTGRFTILLLIFALALLVFPAVGEACPTCKDGMAEGGPHTASMIQGYFYSILFMMAMPFLILGGLSALFYWEIVKARREQALREAADSEAANEAFRPAPDPS